MDDSTKTPAEAKAGGGAVPEVGKARHEEVRQVPDRAEVADAVDEASLALEPRADDKRAGNEPTAEAVESSLTSLPDGDEADLDEAELELGPAPELPGGAPPEPGALKPRTPQLDTANPVVARSAEPTTGRCGRTDGRRPCTTTTETCSWSRPHTTTAIPFPQRTR